MLPPVNKKSYQTVPAASKQPQQDGLDSRILSIAAPSLLALALDPFLGTIDTGFVGRMSPSSELGLAALGVSASTFGLIYPSTNFLSNTATPLVAERRDYKLAVGICVVGCLFGLALGLGVEACAPWIVGSVGGVGPESEVFETAVSVARLRAFSAPAVAATNALNGCLRGFGDNTSPLRAAILAALVNIVLDIALVPTWGAEGSAIATAVAETAAACGLAYAFVSAGRSSTSESIDAHEPIDFKALAPFAQFAALTLARTASLQVFLAACTNAVGSAGGSQALAAHHILRSLYTLLSFATDALAIAAQQLVAAAETDSDKRIIARRLLGPWGIGIGVFFALFLALAADPVVGAIDADEAVRNLAVPRVRGILAPLQILSSFVFVADGVLQGSRAFAFEAKAMAFSTLVAGIALYSFPLLPVWSSSSDGATDILDIAWSAVCVLQAARALTFFCWWCSSSSSKSPTMQPMSQEDEDDS